MMGALAWRHCSRVGMSEHWRPPGAESASSIPRRIRTIAGPPQRSMLSPHTASLHSQRTPRHPPTLTACVSHMMNPSPLPPSASAVSSCMPVTLPTASLKPSPSWRLRALQRAVPLMLCSPAGPAAGPTARASSSAAALRRRGRGPSPGHAAATASARPRAAAVRRGSRSRATMTPLRRPPMLPQSCDRRKAPRLSGCVRKATRAAGEERAGWASAACGPTERRV